MEQAQAVRLVEQLAQVSEPRLIAVRQPSEAERKLKLALKLGGMHHTFSVAQLVGIYPA